MTLLTKSKYMTGLQCSKYLWTLFHEPDKIPEHGEVAQYRFEEGTKVGKIATKVFPNGIDLSETESKENLEETEKALKRERPIFEAGFMADNCSSRVDILIPKGKKWDIIEVKSSTKVKDVHIQDVSFQKFCCEKKGLKIRKCILMHVNNKYIRKGKIEPEKLFIQTDITSEVEEAIKDISERVKEMFKIIKSKECPNLDIGMHCNSPYDCPIEECWDFLPTNNVGHLYCSNKKSFELIEMGVYSIKDIPEDIELSEKQQIQKQCELTNKPYIDKEEIGKFLKKLEYPLYYLDFETFNSAVPLYDGVRPYQQIPFQFSLHVVDGKKVKHYSFLASGSKDPRKEFSESLKKVLGSKGSVIVYNKSFEIKILKELGEMFGIEEWVSKVVERVVDLLVPFRSFYYYNALQKGSASIKNVLPALTGKSYEGLEIADGFTASLAYMRGEFYDVSSSEREKVRANLEKYCCLDTEGMVWIVEALGKIV